MPPRRASSSSEGREPACRLCGMRAVRRLTQLRCWVVPGRDSSSSAGSVRRVPSLHSAVEFNLVAIPPGLCREESRQKPSGRPGHGRLGRWRRQCQSSFQGIKTFGLAAPPRCPSQTAPVPSHQRCCVVLGFVGQCLFANTVVPRINVGARSLLWAVPAQAPEAVCPALLLPVFAGGREPKVSRPLSRQSQSALPHQTASGARPPLPSVAPAPRSLADSLPAPAIPRTLLPSKRLPTTKALKLTYA